MGTIVITRRRSSERPVTAVTHVKTSSHVWRLQTGLMFPSHFVTPTPHPPQSPLPVFMLHWPPVRCYLLSHWETDGYRGEGKRNKEWMEKAKIKTDRQKRTERGKRGKKKNERRQRVKKERAVKKENRTGERREPVITMLRRIFKEKMHRWNITRISPLNFINRHFFFRLFKLKLLFGWLDSLFCFLIVFSSGAFFYTFWWLVPLCHWGRTSKFSNDCSL